jgi:hypothetical protein
MAKAEVALERSIRRATSGPVEIVWTDWNVGRRRGLISAEPGPGWATEFSGFRFALPEAAGFRGRALYLDVDMLALRDLRELFEMPMERPVLTTPSCSATMLFDCGYFQDKTWWPRLAQMKASGWNIGEYARILKRHGARGDLHPRWNCLDGQGFARGDTGIVHFTRRRTQPWRPYPDVFEYEPHPDKALEDLWRKLYEEGERERRAADLQVV